MTTHHHRTSSRPTRHLASLAALLLIPGLGACDDASPREEELNDASGTLAPQAASWGDVAPIFQARCVSCHQSGGIAPFALDDYESASRWAAPAAAAVQARIMPPWLMNDDGSCQHFESSRYLSEEEIQTLVNWAAAGAPAGETEATITIPRMPQLDRGTSYHTPDFEPVASGDELARFDEYRCFRVGAPLDTTGFLTGYEILPGNAPLVHHVLVMPVDPAFQTADGRSNEQVMLELDAQSPDRDGWPCFGAAGEGVEPYALPVTWAPGMGPVQYPSGTGVRVDAGTVWVAQVHYNIAQEGTLGQTDSTEIRLRLDPSADRPGFFDLADRFLETLFAGEPASLAPGQAELPYTWQLDVNDYLDETGASELQLYGVFPHMHELGRSMKVERIAAGEPASDCLGDVPRWDFNWQLFYFYRQPVTLRRGDQIRVTCDFDTSSRTEATLPGWGTQNEMCLAGLFLVP